MREPSRKGISTDKLFYRIGEVSEIAGLQQYVLRYWETEFPFLKPRKNKTGQRVYSRKDLELILQIKDLLYKEKYTIAGVRKRFGDNTLKKSSVSLQTIKGVRKRLKEILNTLNRDIVTHKPHISADKEREPRLYL